MLKLRNETDEEEEEPSHKAAGKVLPPGKGKSPLEQLREEISRQLAFGSSFVSIVTPSYRRVASPMDSESDASGEEGDNAGAGEVETEVKTIVDVPKAEGYAVMKLKYKGEETLVEEAPIGASESSLMDDDQVMIAELVA